VIGVSRLVNGVRELSGKDKRGFNSFCGTQLATSGWTFRPNFKVKVEQIMSEANGHGTATISVSACYPAELVTRYETRARAVGKKFGAYFKEQSLLAFSLLERKTCKKKINEDIFKLLQGMHIEQGTMKELFYGKKEDTGERVEETVDGVTSQEMDTRSAIDTVQKSVNSGNTKIKVVTETLGVVNGNVAAPTSEKGSNLPGKLSKIGKRLEELNVRVEEEVSKKMTHMLNWKWTLAIMITLVLGFGGGCICMYQYFESRKPAPIDNGLGASVVLPENQPKVEALTDKPGNQMGSNKLQVNSKSGRK
jgi:hypothetical protein